MMFINDVYHRRSSGANIHHICAMDGKSLNPIHPHLPLFHTEMEQFCWSISTLMLSMPCNFCRRETAQDVDTDVMAVTIFQAFFISGWLGNTIGHTPSILTLRYGGGSKPIIINSNGMNIHLPAILGFTRCQGFDQ